MKNLFKFVFVALFLCFMALLTSCEYGGTIIVKNNYSTDKDVTVYSDFSLSSFIFTYEDMYGPKTIVAGSSDVFNVKSNTTYGIVWYVDGVSKYQTVEVSNGDTVEVRIP